jgi:uncharacterized membrane protein
MNWSFDPIWPWSLLTSPSGEPSYSWSARLTQYGLSVLLILVPLALVGLTAWTYLGDARTPRRRAAAVLTLRLGAFLLALLAILRPSLAFTDKSQNRTQLFLALDKSRSMTIQDEFNNSSRWQYLLRTLHDCEPTLQRLRDEAGIDVSLYTFAADTAEFNPDEPGDADGSRTDTGSMLRHLFDTRDGRRPPRGLLVLSDGADNGGTRNPPLGEAARWRGIPCPIHTFAVGKTTTPDLLNDIALTAIAIEPTPVRVKGKLTARVTVNAPGLENSEVRLRLFLDGKEAKGINVRLTKPENNEFELECDAPATPGEVKVTVRAEDPKREGQPPPGDLNPANNEIATFATVSKEGISVLLVDKYRWERKFISRALARDPRIQVKELLLGGDVPDPNTQALLQFDRQPYDVIILGDVKAEQLKKIEPQVLAGIKKLVEKGTGFLMTGGYFSFGNSDWQGTDIDTILPVNVRNGKSSGQVEGKVQMLPTEAGLRTFSYIMRLADGKDKEQQEAWEKLPPFTKGISKLDVGDTGVEVILAKTKDERPVLVSRNYVNGRVLAFAGDSTHEWIRKPESEAAHERFWQHVVVWLAKQEDAEGSVWVRPDTRRLPVRSDLGFSVGVRGKNGADLADGTFKVEVVGPDGVKHSATTARGLSEDRGTFVKTDAPGEYRLVVKGEAKDPTTGETVSGEASARFLVYDEDLELVHRAADHDFLKKLASAGGGQFHLAEELPRFLQQLQNQPLAAGKPKTDLRPDWRTTTRSPFLTIFYVLFVALLTGEWFLRRRWGMV